MEDALFLGFDPLSDADSCVAGGVRFEPCWKGFGGETKLVLQSSRVMDVGEISEAFQTFSQVVNVGLVSEAELDNGDEVIGLDALEVPKGHRCVVSNLISDFEEISKLLNCGLLEIDIEENSVQFFRVNEPQEGVHVLLGSFPSQAKLRQVLNTANSIGNCKFEPYTNNGLNGDFW
ncbi:hypothetical protein GCM10011517_33240 [Actibacterium pelagium]|uniref:Uncharacterized protein n=2 Tax=Actibacterium pelagium TaxID=2029103 RepID=A0A917ANF8_9RHOB|nr:hypothetical protein GCM10011517_33240 [Actibacterium pelagium]